MENPSGSPPEDPGAATPADHVITFAIDRLFLGETDRNGTPKPQAWRNFGYNIDGLESTKDDSNHCMPRDGANPSTFKTDGASGIDNAWGASLLPIIFGVDSKTACAMNDRLATGAWTILLHYENLGGASDQSGVRTSVYTGASLGSTPLWNGTDAWPVAQEGLVSSGDIESSKLKFAASYVADGVWVGRSGAGVLRIELPMNGKRLFLDITQPVISANVNDQAAVVGGVISGVLKTEDLIQDLQRVAGSLDSSLCSGLNFDSVAQVIRSTSDILADGTNASGSPCDGISIGLGFTAKPVVRGPIGALDPREDACL